jgi:acetyl-CoA carboxylase carboxyl transferase subunit alpha
MATRPVSYYYLPFEEPLKAFDERIAKLEDLSKQNNMDMSSEIQLQVVARERFLRDMVARLSAWDRVQLARHVHRPQTLDYIDLMCDDFLELHGDRAFADDRAIVAGFATLDDMRVVLIGQQKGRDVQERSRCNFGCPQPEGYRKALRIMRLAEKLQLPIVCLVDTKGAAPDIGAEERGQSEAIARNLAIMSGLRVPIVCVVIGEGGSGGALAIAVGDRVMIQEYAYFSVISPEGCASILWKDAEKKADAAAALKLTAPELVRLGVMDGIVPEPLGGAHRDPSAAAKMLREAILHYVRELLAVPAAQLLTRRYARLRDMGRYREQGPESGTAHATD